MPLDPKNSYTLRLLRASWALWGRVSALGGRVWDLTTRVQEAEGTKWSPIPESRPVRRLEP